MSSQLPVPSTSLEHEARHAIRQILADSLAALDVESAEGGRREPEARSEEPLPAAPLAHRLRRNNKKLLALLELLRDAVDEASYEAEREALRTVSRMLAAPRRAAVMLEWLAKLQSKTEQSFDPLLRVLAEDHRARSAEAFAPSMRAELRRRLVESVARVERWSFSGLDRGVLLSGLTRSYSRAHAHLGRAQKRPGSRRLHRLRKWTKIHYHQMRLWPGFAAVASGGRLDSSRRAADARKRLDSLAERLGAEHDLSELADLVARDGPALLEVDALRELEREIRERRARLRRSCLRRGERLFDARPAKARRRLARKLG